jgi:hypothetical protein
MREQRLVLQQVRLRLRELRVERTAIDLEQHRTLPYLVAFAKAHGDDLSVDACLHRDAGVRLDVADRVQRHRHALLNDLPGM